MSSVSKIISLIQEEVGGCFYPPFVAASALVRLLPPQSFGRTRAALYRLFGMQVGAKTILGGALTLGSSRFMKKHLTIGTKCWFNTHIYFDLNAPINIGDRVAIGHHVIVVTSNHELGPPGFRAGRLTPKPVTIENGAWIGARAMLLPGVTVGAGAVVAAGAVVTKDVAPNTLVGGVPARLIRAIEPSPVQ